ncbi:AMP-dependent synthetase [Methylobacterium aerolatum]|uniref:Uncharacterized protein n=1 Tax=Methylobacterium aerolatum TaxID=418708 RepID=A0ABU0HY91_9HYPH|nr:AMP-dependent synthetase [Methylobacterium aerolatum]MDQ0447308.1 hypothetical protein [Methylobacterium aerolatum]GJD36972.1 hypothetical protein FMGBMHLM_3898 [Methylobacterium aerolatum]
MIRAHSIAADRNAAEFPAPVPSQDRREVAPAPSAIAPGLCMKWARAEGIGLGDTAVLMVANPLESAALRQGLAWVGARTRDLAPGLDADTLAAALKGATVAIVDAALADDYARALGLIERLPPVWWNGEGADFARLDHALAELAD